MFGRSSLTPEPDPDTLLNPDPDPACRGQYGPPNPDPDPARDL